MPDKPDPKLLAVAQQHLAAAAHSLRQARLELDTQAEEFDTETKQKLLDLSDELSKTMNRVRVVDNRVDAIAKGK